MAPQHPHRVRFTDHAVVKAAMLGYATADVVAVVLEHHEQRRRNRGAAQWRVEVDRLVVVYDHPDDADPGCARVVTLWRRR